MGAWGTGIRQDDLVCDVLDMFQQGLRAGRDVASASTAVLEHFAEVQDDPDEAPLLSIALAEAQWMFGAVEPNLLAKVISDVESDRSVYAWMRADPRDLAARRRVLAHFVAKISRPNPRPKRWPTTRRILRAPKYEPGTCLAVTLPDGLFFAAALVLAANSDDPEYGLNLVGVLDFLSVDRPDISVFDGRKWLCLSHHKYDGQLDISWYGPVGFRKEKARFHVVASSPVRPDDPQVSMVHTSWSHLGLQAAYQREWDNVHPR